MDVKVVLYETAFLTHSIHHFNHVQNGSKTKGHYTEVETLGKVKTPKNEISPIIVKVAWKCSPHYRACAHILFITWSGVVKFRISEPGKTTILVRDHQHY